jgi:DNA-binding CsgD family transcriptional regulator
MPTTPPSAPDEPEKSRDPRGARPGQHGQQPFVATEAQRQRVRTLAQTLPEQSNEGIAIQIGISRSTLEKHFRHDLDLGRAQMVSAVAAQLIQRALKGDDALGEDGKPIAPGNLQAQMFILARRANWSSKVEHGGKGGGPIEVVDLSGLSAAALREYGRQAAIAQGLDPDKTVGPPLDD